MVSNHYTPIKDAHIWADNLALELDVIAGSRGESRGDCDLARPMICAETSGRNLLECKFIRLRSSVSPTIGDQSAGGRCNRSSSLHLIDLEITIDVHRIRRRGISSRKDCRSISLDIRAGEIDTACSTECRWRGSLRRRRRQIVENRPPGVGCAEQHAIGVVEIDVPRALCRLCAVAIERSLVNFHLPIVERDARFGRILGGFERALRHVVSVVDQLGFQHRGLLASLDYVLKDQLGLLGHYLSAEARNCISRISLDFDAGVNEYPRRERITHCLHAVQFRKCIRLLDVFSLTSAVKEVRLDIGGEPGERSEGDRIVKTVLQIGQKLRSE